MERIRRGEPNARPAGADQLIHDVREGNAGHARPGSDLQRSYRRFDRVAGRPPRSRHLLGCRHERISVHGPPLRNGARAGILYRVPSHAVVAVFETDLSQLDAQQMGLERFIVPSVRSAPGFVSGYWTLDREAGTSLAFIVFENELAAQALRDNVRANAEAQVAVGLRLSSIRVVEMQASA